MHLAGIGSASVYHERKLTIARSKFKSLPREMGVGETRKLLLQSTNELVLRRETIGFKAPSFTCLSLCIANARSSSSSSFLLNRRSWRDDVTFRKSYVWILKNSKGRHIWFANSCSIAPFVTYANCQIRLKQRPFVTENI